MPQTIDFAIDGFRWDARSNRYRWSAGAGKNQFASRKAVLEYSKREIVRQSNQLVDLADQLADGSITLEQFQRRAAQHLRQIHLLQAVISAGGSDKLFANDYLIVGRQLRDQYYSGVDVTGQRYGLRFLAADIQTGKVSQAQLRQRLKLFAASGKRSYWAIFQAKNEGKFGFRVLGIGEHCPECLDYSREPPQSISTITRPAEACSCMNLCACSIKIFNTLEEAILAKGV